ncbi:MAG: hypothetical protein WAN22_34780 [Solirubrobacteraceae bacterium]
MLCEPTGQPSPTRGDALSQVLIGSECRLPHGTGDHRSAPTDAANLAHGTVPVDSRHAREQIHRDNDIERSVIKRHRPHIAQHLTCG